MSLKVEGFGFESGDKGVAIGGDLACCLVGVAAAPVVAVYGDPIIFDGEESSDFGNRELGLLMSISKEIESERKALFL